MTAPTPAELAALDATARLEYEKLARRMTPPAALAIARDRARRRAATDALSATGE